MQLSAAAPSTPTDASLAAQFFATGGTGSSAPAAPGSAASPDGEAATGFADLLSDAVAPLGDEVATTGPTDSVLGGPTAAVSLANYPQWLLGSQGGTAATVASPGAPTVAVPGTGVVADPTCADASVPVAPTNGTGASSVKTGRNARPSAQPTGPGTNGVVPAAAAAASPASTDVVAMAAQVVAPIPTTTAESVEAASDTESTELGQQTGAGQGLASSPSSARMNFSAGANAPGAMGATSVATTRPTGLTGGTDESPVSDPLVASDSFAQNFSTTQAATSPRSPEVAPAPAPIALEAEVAQAISGTVAVPSLSTTARASFTSDFSGTSNQLEGSSTAESATDVAPAIQFEGSIPTREEIIAALDGQISPAKNSSANVPEKTFLSSAAKRVTTRESTLGTDVAKLEAAMPSATFSTRQSFVAPLERAIDVPVASASAPSAAPQTTEPAAVAQRAVDAVLTAVERFSAGDRHSVQMQFSVGGTDLSVRVEMRGDEVRTTFRTDSPELRNALAHEWQSASTDNASADRSVRVTPPVFASNDSSSFTGDNASRQRDARTQKGEADDFLSAVAARSHSMGAFGSAMADVAAPAARALVPGTSLHLSTLA